VKAGDGHPSCPAWEGEDAGDYIDRFARKLGLPIGSNPMKREWPRDGRSQEARIDAIMRGERDEEREPGGEG
jgi:hypothetical protein